MRILVLQPSPREQHVLLDQRVDDGLVGVALLAVVVDDARRPPLAVRPEARRILGEIAGIVHGEGDQRFDAARAQLRRGIHPGVKILAAMSRRCVYEARAGIVGDVVAGEQWDSRNRIRRRGL